MDIAAPTGAAAPLEQDPPRDLAIARPEDPALTHLAVVGDTYTVLLSGEQTAGRLRDARHADPAGRRTSTPSRHDFEECFRVLEGSLEVYVRDLPPVRLEAGDSANIPANAAHTFRNRRTSRRAAVHRRARRPGEVLRRVRRSRAHPHLTRAITQRHGA